MDKQRALNILIAHGCCMSTGFLCEYCPFENTNDCKNLVFDDVLGEAVRIVFKKEQKIMRKMKLSDIRITSAFSESTPSEEKMKECREFWRYEGKQDRPIVVNHNNVLVDGYCMYLVLKEHKEEFADVMQYKKKRHNKRYEKLPKANAAYKNTSTTYIFGTHPNSNCIKEFVWRVPASWGNWSDNIEIGDTVLCQTKFGFSPVVVNRVEVLDKPPVEMRVKRVAKREIRKNGS